MGCSSPSVLGRMCIRDSPIASTLLAPDCAQGGQLLYNGEELAKIYETGRGSFRLRAKYRVLPKENIIEIYEIPYTTTVEAVIDKIIELSKACLLYTSCSAWPTGPAS